MDYQWCSRERRLRRVYRGLRGLSEVPFTWRDPSDTCKPHSGVFLRSISLGHHWRSIAYTFYFKEYSGNWTCQLESYHQSHENDHNFGKNANGSIHVTVIPKSKITNLTTSEEKVPNDPKKESQNPGKKVQSSDITSGLAHANSFDLVKVEPKNATVLEGSNLDLFCSVNEYFGFCTFYHSGKNCEFQWKKNSWNFTNYDCPGNPFGHPAVLIEGLYKNETCGIRLTKVTKVII